MDVQVLTAQSDAFDVNTAAVKSTLSFCHKARIVAAGLLIRGTDAGGATVKLTKAIVAGTAPSPTGDVAIIVIPAANSVNKIIYSELSTAGVEVDAGDEIAVEVTAEGVSALSVVAFVDFVRLDEQLVNCAKGQLTT